MFAIRRDVLMGSLVLLVSSVTDAAGPPAGFAMPVETAVVKRDSVSQRISAVGNLLANESVVIRPEISGRVADIHFKEGDPIKKGAVLITLEQGEALARTAESQAQVQVTKVSFDRATELIKKNLISQQQLDDATAQYTAAMARLNVNQELLKKTVLSAPFDGIAGLRQVSPGDYVQPGQIVVNVLDQHLLKAEFQVPEIYLAQLRNGMDVRLRSDAYPGKQFSGKVYAIAPNINANSRSITLRAKITNDDNLLRAGLFAHIDLQLSHNAKALVIPEEALWPMGDKQFVYQVVDGKAKLAPIKTGLRLDGRVEIIEGLHEGDQVVTGGQMKLRPDAAVMSINAAAKPDAKPATPAAGAK
jgi:membrane fusion protein, multidrug efflux system